LPNLIFHDEPKHLALLGPGLLREQIRSPTGEDQQIKGFLGRRQCSSASVQCDSNALLILVDFTGLLIVSPGVDSPVEAVFIKNIEAPLESLQVCLMAPKRLLPRRLFGLIAADQFVSQPFHDFGDDHQFPQSHRENWL
jgi:hypothetical protein